MTATVEQTNEALISTYMIKLTSVGNNITDPYPHINIGKRHIHNNHFEPRTRISK